MLSVEDFKQLDQHTQESFINSGGIVKNLAQVTESPVLTSQETRLPLGSMQADKNSLSPTNIVAHTPNDTSNNCDGLPLLPSQPASSIYTEGFDIKDPVELLFLVDDDIASGETLLHDWQIQFMMDFANEQHIKEFPFQAEVRACNGSGKDKYIVAVCAVWLCMRYRQARCVVTNGSGVQLDNQTEAYIEQLAKKVNRKFGQLIWKTNYRYYECLPTESPIVLFATDEPLKAEGYHPLVPKGKMALFASEAKGVLEEIFTAQNRCTGFTHRIDVSTPGLPMGTFFNRCSTAVSRKMIKDIKKDISPADNIEYHIRASDCKHITANELKILEREMPGGKDGPAYRSAVEAEFGTTDEMVVIPYSYVYIATKKKTDADWKREEFNKAGLDLSDGGDECVLFTRNGNKHLYTDAFRFDQPDDTIQYLEDKFKERQLTNPKAYVFGDYGGIGSIILKRLQRKGWSNIRFRDNRAKTSRPKIYKNWGAESWFHLSLLLKRKELILKGDDPKLIKQLSTRYFKLIDGQVHQLLSKLEMRNRGYHSPDRADAAVLSFSDYETSYNYSEEEKKKPFEASLYVEEEVKVKGDFTLKGQSGDHKASSMARWNINNRQKNFRELQEAVSDHNRNLVTIN